MEEKNNLKSKKFNQKSYLYGMYKNKFYPVINFEKLLNFEEELTLKKQYFEFEKQFKLEEKIHSMNTFSFTITYFFNNFLTYIMISYFNIYMILITTKLKNCIPAFTIIIIEYNFFIFIIVKIIFFIKRNIIRIGFFKNI